MATASAVTGLSSQSRPGLAARVARRLGGAVRTVMASGITLAGNLRRPVVPAFTRDPVAAGDLNAPVPPNASGAADQPRDAATPVASVEAARSGLLPRVLRHHRRRSPGGDTPFTPKNCPGLSREMCKLLNTPLGDCDPAMARMMFTALEEYFVGRLPADAGAEGAELVHAVIWGRLGGLFDEPGPDASPAEAADPASATPMEVVPASTANAAADAPAQATLVALTDAAPAAAMDTVASVVAASAPDAEMDTAPHASPNAWADVSPDTWRLAATDAEHDARLAAAPALPEGFLALLATALRGTPPMPPSPLVTHKQPPWQMPPRSPSLPQRRPRQTPPSRRNRACAAINHSCAVENISFPPPPIAFPPLPPALRLLVWFCQIQRAQRTALSAIAAAAVLRRAPKIARQIQESSRGHRMAVPPS